MAARFEESVFSDATSQTKYLRKMSLKMLILAREGQHPTANYFPSIVLSPSLYPFYSFTLSKNFFNSLLYKEPSCLTSLCFTDQLIYGEFQKACLNNGRGDNSLRSIDVAKGAEYLISFGANRHFCIKICPAALVMNYASEKTTGAVSFRSSGQFFLQKLFVAMIMQLCGQRTD
ncbi:hypothetical protein ACS0TY_005700 [Phlomoides rotata]